MTVVISDIDPSRLPANEEFRFFFPDSSHHSCVGCFQCWTKTPGECVIHDGLEKIGPCLGAADELILISRCCFGSLSPQVKKALDRSISYIHPYFQVREGELHHKSRYANHLRISAFVYGAASEAERNTMRGILQANAVNFDAALANVAFYPDRGSLLENVRL